MPHIVILTPKGADVTTGKEALEAAGFEVEVVDAEAANLIHIASGMLENDELPKEDEESTEDVAAEEPNDTELPAAADLAKPEKKSKESVTADENKQANESFLGNVTIDDEPVPAYLGKSNTLWAGGLTKNSDMLNKVTFRLNESVVSIWKDTKTPMLNLTVNGKPVSAKLMEAKGKTKLVVNAKTAKLLKLRK